MPRKKKTETISQTALGQLSKDLDTVLAQNQKGLAVKQAKTFNVLKVFFGLIMVLGVFTWLKSYSLDKVLPSSSNPLVTAYEATEEEFEFRWTLADYDQIEGSIDEPGETIDEIIAVYGKPSSVWDYSDDDFLSVEYSQSSEESKLLNPASVDLFFAKEDGTFRLKNKAFFYFSLPDELGFDKAAAGKAWTEEEYKLLKEGTQTGLGGTSLQEIWDRHGAPKESYIHLTDLGRRIKILYTAYDPDYYYVSLNFIESANGDWLLSDKYGSFDD